MNVVSSLSTIPVMNGDELLFLHVEVCNTSGFITVGKPLAFFHCAVVLKDTNTNPLFASSPKDFILKEGESISDNDYLKAISEPLRLHILSEILKNFRPINRQFQNFRYFVNIHFVKNVAHIDSKTINRTSEYTSEVVLDKLDDCSYIVQITRSIDRLQDGSNEYVRLGFVANKMPDKNVMIEFKELLPPHITEQKRIVLCEHIAAQIVRNYSFVDPKFQLRQYFAKMRVVWVKQ